MAAPHLQLTEVVMRKALASIRRHHGTPRTEIVQRLLNQLDNSRFRHSGCVADRIAQPLGLDVMLELRSRPGPSAFSQIIFGRQIKR